MHFDTTLLFIIKCVMPELVVVDSDPGTAQTPAPEETSPPEEEMTTLEVPPYEPIIRATAPAIEPLPSQSISLAPQESTPTIPQSPLIGTDEIVRNNSSATPLPQQQLYPRYNMRYPQKPRPGKPRAAAEWGERAWKAQQANDFKKAVEFYENATRLDPSNLSVQYNLGYCAERINDMNTALEAYEVALRIDPRSTKTRYTFAMALDRAGFPIDAAHEFERLLFDDAENVSAHFALAKIYAEKLRRNQSAKTHYQRVLSLDSNHPQANEIRAWINSRP